MSTNISMPEPQTLLTGIALGESPRWHANRLWFSDWMAQELSAVDLRGKRELILRIRDFPFCFDWLLDGRLLLVSGRRGLVLCQEPDGSLITYADLTALSTRAWNEIVVDTRGNAYVNTIGFDFPGGEFAPGLIALITPDGTVEQVADNVAFPNGMVVTPDNSRLILAESYGSKLTAFDIARDGTLSNRRVWAETKDDHPDGICLDSENAVWYADVGNKHCIRVREGGEILQTVDADRGCFACELGGPDMRTLFIMANEWGGPQTMTGDNLTGKIITVQVAVPGIGKVC